MQKVRANIFLDNIKSNAAAFSAMTERPLIAVVKANAYGHGAEEVVNALEGIVSGFAVAILEEGLAIRQAACGKEILVLTPPTDEEEIFLLAANGFSATVGDWNTVRLLSEFVSRRQIPISMHLKVNTGMNRYGFETNEIQDVCAYLAKERLLSMVGIYTHLAECSLERARKQRAFFQGAVTVCKRFFPAVIAHMGGTYGALLGQEFLFDAVRLGIGLYGYLPCDASEKTGLTEKAIRRLGLKKGMAVYAKTIASRPFLQGSLGYGEELSLSGEGTGISVCRYGYADGFLRVKNNGTDTAPLHANTLCMDACLLFGDTSLGGYQAVLTDAERTAREAGTISYEVLCAATRRAEFVYEKTAFCGNERKNCEGKET